MTGDVMMFRGPVGQRLPSPKLFRPDQMAEAVAEVIERKAPGARRKYVEKHFRMSADDARRVVEGRASKAQLDRMFREGGWGFVLEVFSLFFDRGVDQYLAQERHNHEQRAATLGAISRDLFLGLGVGVPDSAGLDHGGARLGPVSTRGPRQAAVRRSHEGER